jgi:superfamily II DNA or RNA helicase
VPSEVDQLRHVAYGRPLRRYQALALEAFERGRAGGRRHAYLVMPPGSGKTVLGLEIARRLGQRTLVLSPNTAIQVQWVREWRGFEPPLVDATTDPSLPTPITSLTYQSLCNLASHAEQLDDAALLAWHAERTDTGGDEQPHDADLARLRRRERTLIAHGGSREQLLALLHANGRQLVERVGGTGPWTIVLDECHHLLLMWGWLVRALVDELGESVHMVGLTATPPGDMDAREAALYQELFGRADFEVPTPAVVKEGNLAPYQELVYLTTPLDAEARYIADEQLRFDELVVQLLDPDLGSVPFLEWLRLRAFERRARSGAVVAWAAFEREEPALAQAVLRYCVASGLPPPSGAHVREPHRQPLVADDWVAMIDDYCTGHLRHSEEAADVAAWDLVRTALPGIGYRLTRQGVRPATTTVDRVLMLSAGKMVAAVEILAAEQRALGPDLRALVLCDFERAAIGAPLAHGVLDPQAGSAALLLQLLTKDPTAAELRPLLLTGRTVACDRATAPDLVAWLEQASPELAGRLETVSSDGGHDDVVVLRPRLGAWEPRRYVPLVTRYFEAGRSRCLVGTRGLLGEGWDACSVNVLVDLTAVTTRTSVHQVRGRSLRLDPGRPRKVADNWDVVCVAAGHAKGAADYDRFVRKHRGYYALAESGEIESGVSHVMPELSPYGPPSGERFASFNGRMLERPDGRAGAYDRWGVGRPYHNVLADTVRIRFGRTLGPPQRRALRPAPGATTAGVRLPLVASAGGALAALGVGAVSGLAAEGAAAALAAVAAGSWWTGRSMRERMAAAAPTALLDDLAAALREALQAAGLVGREARVRLTVEPDGCYRCLLDGASLEDSRTFAEALDELLAPLDQPRYVVPRFVDDAPRTAWAALWTVLRHAAGRPGRRVVYHAVPAVLAVNHTRAETFGRAWNRHVSAGRPLFQRDPRAQAIIDLQRGEDPLAVTTQMRTLWR